ncbi:MAG: hemolytic enterotoxin [Chloroflexaceae bacterium]|nr:hemolytic enterotoxin [Chloroflexaceae bacterium]
MSLSIEVELKDILAQMNQRLERMEAQMNQRLERMDIQINQRLERMEQKTDDLQIGVARLEEKFERLDEKIDAKTENLADKLENLSKRIDSQEFVSRGILIGLIVAILGGLAKLFDIPGNL